MQQDIESPTPDGIPEPPSQDTQDNRSVEPVASSEDDGDVAVAIEAGEGHRSEAADASLSPPVSLQVMEAALRSIDARLGRLEAQLPQPAQPRLRDTAASVGAGWTAFQLLTLATVCLVVFLRLVQLDQLQNEIYGDIALIFNYLAEIRAYAWPTHFILSSGPLYHYLIVPVVALAGTTYYGLKLASVLASLGVLAAIYALGRRLIDDRFALLAVFIAGVSSWLLIFSRLGNSQILVPLLATCALWLAVRFAQDGRTADLVACAAVSTLGLYVYPQSFVLPLVVGATLLCLRWPGSRVRWLDLWHFALVAGLCAVPFVWIVSRDPHNFFSGYIGGKLDNNSSLSLADALAGNIWRGLLALHVHGDSGFRSNPIGEPHLDRISGLLLLAGVVFWLRPERRRLSPVLFVPLLLLQMPSWLVLSRLEEVPSASRTLGAAPLAYLLVASGLWWLVQIFHARRPGWIGRAVAAALLAAILLLNVQRYFWEYIGGLPYQNTPIGRLVATYLDSLPPETKIYLVGCCWQDSMPEPSGIRYAMARPDQLENKQSQDLSCDWVHFAPRPAVLVWGFYDSLPAPQLAACRDLLPAELYTSPQGLPAFYAARLSSGLPEDSASALPQASGEPLESQLVESDGQTIKVAYSRLDLGKIENIFDHNSDTLIRGANANPLVLELEFAQPRSVSAISLTLATMRLAQIKVDLIDEGGETFSVERDFVDLEGIPEVGLPLPAGPVAIRRMRIEIHDLAPRSGNQPHIHVRELQWR